MKDLKTIVLAGGKAERLRPMMGSKQSQYLYSKPAIYYPLSAAMYTGSRDVHIISTPNDLPQFREHFGDGSQLGMNFSYSVQEQPRGLADAFNVGREFIGSDNVCLILGDNVFFGHGLPELLIKAKNDLEQQGGATIFGKLVRDPKRFGVVEFDSGGKVLSIEEKPDSPRSNYAVTGLYFYDNDVVAIAKGLKPSKRNELEITDVNSEYLRKGNLRVELLGRGYAWFDMGTEESMLKAANFIGSIEQESDQRVACLEEIAYSLGHIDKEQLLRLAKKYEKSGYGQYLSRIAGSK